jgi:hypothetical protein
MRPLFLDNFVLLIGVLSIGSLLHQAAYSQNTKQRMPTLIEYLSTRLAAVNKPIGSGTQAFEAKLTVDALCPIYSRNSALQAVAGRVLSEYGAIFVGDNNAFVDFALDINGKSVRLVPQCIYADEAAVQRYQKLVRVRREIIDGTAIELEANAMAALLDARKDAATKNIRISPRAGSTAARRSYADTKRLWDSRFYPALRYWIARKVITSTLAEEARRMAMLDQIARVLEWEDTRHAYFSKDFTKSILYSVAPPGSSQHLFMLAIDIEQFARRDVRDILAAHGWYQTVKSDLPHFTYLGIKDKNELLGRGLKREVVSGQEFWTPRID